MNWYKRIILSKNIWYNDDDIQQYISSIIEKEIEGRDLNRWQRMEIEEKIHQILSTFPSGYKLKNTEEGWTVFAPNGTAISVNEKLLEQSLPGSKARFDFMGLSVSTTHR